MTDLMRPLFPLRDSPQKPAGPRSTENYFGFADSCIHVSDHASEGDRPLHTIFFLHGRLEDSRDWSPLIQRLRAPGSRARCITIDFPGFGRSFSSRTARTGGLGFHELTALVKQVVSRFSTANTPTVLIARDSGGAIAQVCATDPANNVRAVVLVNSVTLKNRLRPISWLAGKLFCRRLEPMLGRQECLQFVRDHWRNPRARADSLRAINALSHTWPRAEECEKLDRKLRETTFPTLVLWGGRDPVHPIKYGLNMMSMLPDASFFADERLGHWPELENTAWISGRIREFLFHLNMRAQGPVSA